MFRSAVCLLSMLIGTAGLCASAQAADVSFAGVLPDGQLYKAQIESMQDGRYRNIVRQHTDFSCGAAALATLLRYAYGIHVDEPTVIAGLMGIADPETVRKKGFSLLDIKRYIESLGMRGRGYRISEHRLHSVRVPTIVLIEINGYRHFVVLKQVLGDDVEIADPVLGNKSMTLDEFMKAWPSRALFAVIGSGFERNTVLLQTHRTPSARALFNRAGRPLTDAELLDFGFTNADLF